MPDPFHDTDRDPVQQALTDLWETDLVPRLPAGYAEQAVALHAFTRVRGLRSCTDLLRGLLAAALSSCSWKSLSCWAVLRGVADISDRAWAKRLRKAGAWLQWLLQALLSSPDVRHLLPQVSETTRVLLIDASSLKHPGGTGDDWRLHLAYDLLAARMAQASLTDCHTSEALAPFTLRPEDVIVADRGYGYRKNLLSAHQAQARVVFRFSPHTLPLQQADGTPIPLVAWLKEQGDGTYERHAWCVCAGQTIAVRILAQSLPPEAAEQARAKRREDARQHGRKASEDTLYLAGWLLLVTTLPQQGWDRELVIRLYRARWQIELVFKRMKGLLKLSHLRCRTADMVLPTLTTLLIAWSLHEQIGHELRTALQGLPTAMLSTTPLADLVSDEEAVQQEETSQSTLSSWRLTSLGLQTVRQIVLGQWSSAQVLAALPRLHRFLSESPRRRPHQESQIRARLRAVFSPERASFFNCSSA